MAEILYGAPVKEEIKKKLIEKVKRLKKKPVLAILQVGDREDSNLYIKNKIKFGEDIGVAVELRKFKDLKIENFKNLQKPEEEILKTIKNFNEDKNIDGIIVQLPLPGSLDTKKILSQIKKEKDADGLTSPLTPLLEKERGKDGTLLVTPATARAVMDILDFYKITVENKKVAVIGQSLLAGKPISETLEKRGARVFRCDINTENIPEIAKNCDVLVVAVGKAGLVMEEFVNKDQVVIDVGINKIAIEGGKKGKFVGDVDFEKVEPLVSAITPTPGGVGPVTVACLFENLLDLMENRTT